MILDYPAARAVSLVIQTGSFDGAAKALNVTPSAISQRVKALEERLGTILIERGTPCVATDTGALLCRHVEHVGLLEKSLAAKLPVTVDPAGPKQRVTLNVATNADSLGTWFIDAVAAFGRETGDLLNIGIDDEEHTADWLRRGRVLAAVTALAKPVTGCQVRALGRLAYVATASPDYVARHFPGGVTADAIADAPGLVFDQKDRLQQLWIRQTFGRAVAYPSHWLPSTQSFVAATLAGMGWGLNPIGLVRDHLAAGRLVELVPGAMLERPLFWQVNRLAADQLSSLTRHVVAASGRALGR